MASFNETGAFTHFQNFFGRTSNLNFYTFLRLKGPLAATFNERRPPTSRNM